MGKRVEPVRTFLRSLLRDKLKSASDRQRLAEFLGKTESYIKKMIYHGEGGLDAWVSVLVFCYDIDENSLSHLFQDFTQIARKMSPISESDRIWFKLDETLSEEEKVYWANIVRIATDIENDFVKRVRQAQSKKKQRSP